VSEPTHQEGKQQEAVEKAIPPPQAVGVSIVEALKTSQLWVHKLIPVLNYI